MAAGRLIACTAIVLLVAFRPTARGADPPADLVLRHARVLTMANDGRSPTAVAVRGDRIVYVGDERGVAAWIAAGTRVLDLPGCTVTPGLVDAHGHLHNLGRILSEPNLVGTRSKDEVLRRVLDYESKLEGSDWVHGRGWDQNDWSVASFPNFRDLDATNGHPVYLDRVDGHAVWLNRRALEMAHITRATPDPPGGKIVRDEHGDPTGILVDNATDLVDAVVPPPSAALVEQRLAAAIAECNRVGLTGVHDAAVSRAVFEALRRLATRDALTLTIYCMIDSQDDAFARERLAAGPSREFGGRLVARCFKLRADGALGSRGAALLAPYDDDPGNVGLNVQPPESLLAWTRVALKHGFQVGTHAIGDRANRTILDVYERTLDETGTKDARLRVEHCQILGLDDIPRFARLGVIASMQPTHATSDMPWAEKRVGHDRLRGAYAWRSILTSGAALAFGSDFPVESPDPVRGLYAAVTRQDAQGNPPGGWWPDQKLTLTEALRAFTEGAAYASFDEKDAGTIAAGMRADLTVLDRDITTGDARMLLTTHARYTIVRGRVVYERP